MNNLKIAIQKNGRLYEQSLELLKSCGIKIDNGKDQLKFTTPNFPMDILYLRNSDIPQYLEDGVVDIAIIGENLLVEKNTKANILQKLGFAKCRVCLAIPKTKNAIDRTYFNGKKIATSYPNTLQVYLQKNNIEAEIHIISGSVEIAPSIGLADGICDVVSSGSTLFKNGLKSIETLLYSEAVLASFTRLNKEKYTILDKLLFRIKAVLKAKNAKYILMNIPNEKIEQVTHILPFLKSPTILPLAQRGWSSLHTVIQEDAFWHVIDELKAMGAEDILVIPIDKIVL